MAVVWARETARDRGLELQKDGATASRSWIVRVDDPATSLGSIQSECGVAIGDAHPTETDLSCDRVSVRSSDDSGLLYQVTADYSPDASSSGSDGSGGDGSGGGEESEVEGRYKQWGGSSSVASEPVFLDAANNVMTNSAGDPLEGLEAEKAQLHLTLTDYYKFATTNQNNGWLDHAKIYTNAINSDGWNGGDPGQWKCQGCSAKLVIDRGGPNNAPRAYWEVNWDFAFRDKYWALRPWDIGFNELVDDNGEPQPVGGISAGDAYNGEGGGNGGGSGGSGGPCAGGLKRRSIKGQDNKPVRQPVALQNGIAKEPCLRPDELWFDVYTRQAFTPIFGEVFTPRP